MKNSSKKVTFVLVIIILVSNMAWALVYSSQKNALRKSEHTLEAAAKNKKIMAFQKLFIDKVLESDGVVDFDTRVALQNSVNATGDNAVIAAWNKFLKSNTEAEGQQRVKELLSLISSKVYSE